MKNRTHKITPKRIYLRDKIWYIVSPFLVFLKDKTFFELLLSMLVSAIPVRDFSVWLVTHSYQMSAVINAVASIIAARFVLNEFLIEVAVLGEVDIDLSSFKQYTRFIRNGFWGYKDVSTDSTPNKIKKMILVAMLAISTTFTFNIFVRLISVESAKYDNVEQIQYSVPIWLGLILYGVVSPMVEEMVFRGVIYNRVKKFYPVWKSVLVSAVLFGVFHGNILQFIYGVIMGILIALCYEWMGCFGAPVICHAAANIFAFMWTSITNGSNIYVSWGNFMISLLISGLILGILWNVKNKLQA